MKVGKHAIRRYKQRIGRRTASRERIIKDIKNQIQNHCTKKIYNDFTGQYRVETSKFVAVCEKGTVVTILPINEQQLSG